MSTRPPVIDSNRCTGCLACEAACPQRAIIPRWEPAMLTLWLRPALCIFCGRCAAVCPEAAISDGEIPPAPSKEIKEILLAKLAAVECRICRTMFAATPVLQGLNAKLSSEDRKFWSPRQNCCARCRREQASQSMQRSKSGEIAK